jgi:RNA polymerase sigma-70 factor (ECF subfamily)
VGPASIEEGCELVRQALQSRAFGAYTVQAAIAAVHAEAATAEETDWAEIVGLYDVLQRHWPSAVVELNRAVALAKRDGPEVGLREVEGILARGSCWTITWRMRRGPSCIISWGKWRRRAAWQQALALTRQAPERRHIERRLKLIE